MFPKTDI